VWKTFNQYSSRNSCQLSVSI